MSRIMLFLFASLLTTGCSITPKYRVTIDAITAPNLSLTPSAYTIKALDNQKDTQDLIFQQYSNKLSKLLDEKGYLKVANNSLAQQIIYFDYGIEKLKEETEIYSEPDISFHIGWGHPFGGYYGHHHPFYHDFYGGGYTTYRQTRIYYNRYVTILAKEKMGKELWRVDVSSVGESKNLRKIIPILLEAAQPYFGHNTDEPVELVIKDKNKKG